MSSLSTLEPPRTASITLASLSRLSYAQLDELFRNAPAGEIPHGTSQGRALIFPGTILASPIAFLVRLLAWKGKTVYSGEGYLLNRILPFGIRAIKARVCKTQSWFDEKECIVLDYSKTSLFARFIRDEIRLIAPNLYLGIVYIGKSKTIHFAIQFP
jgi:hypothetical protein